MITPIKYLTGDATEPIETLGRRVIVHICNDVGKWGKGFVLALSNKWPDPQQMFQLCQPARLGEIQVAEVEPGLEVVNMIAQHDVKWGPDGLPPIRYLALFVCLTKVQKQLSGAPFVSVHMPRIGSGLAGGSWQLVAAIVEDRLSKHGIPVFVYNLPSTSR